MHDTCTIALSTTTIRITDRDGISVVEVTGEIDMLSGGPIVAILTRQLDERPQGLVVDLTRIAFFGSTGIRILVDTVLHAQGHGVDLAVAADQRVVLHPLRITGVDELLNIRPTVDLAIATLRPGHASTAQPPAPRQHMDEHQASA